MTRQNSLLVSGVAFTVLLLLGSIGTQPASAQEVLANPGFELGYPGTTYSGGPNGTSSTWTSAGSSGSATTMPIDWIVNSSGTPSNESQWVESAGNGAGGSDHFIYLPAGNDLCIEPLFSSMSGGGLKAGTTYRFSVDLASADTTIDASLTASLTTQASGSFARLYTDNTKTTTLWLDTTVTELSGFGDNIHGRNLATISSTDLDAFNFNWTNYQFTFTTPLTYWDDVNGVQVTHSAGDTMTDISLDISNDFAGGGAFVVDNFSMQAIPEPTSALLLGFGAMLALFRRQRRKVQ